MPTPRLGSDRCAAAADDERAYPRVLVIVLNYGGWQDTIACLTSLQSLSYPAWQLLVIDNASPSGSVSQIRRAFPDVELLVTERNLGFGCGNNRGLELALQRGFDYAWLLNNDTLVRPETLGAMVEVAEQDAQLGAVGSLIYALDRPDHLLAYGGGRFRIAWGHAYHIRHPHEGLSFLTGASLLLRTEALRAVGLFDERYFFLWEDVDLSLRLQQAGWKLAVADGSRVWHKDGGTAPAATPFRIEQHAAGLVLTLRKHAAWPHLSAFPILAFYCFMALRRRSMAILRAAFRGWFRGWRVGLGSAPSDHDA